MRDPCTCKRFCTDTDDEEGTCKGLPELPREPDVEVILVPVAGYPRNWTEADHAADVGW